MGKLRLLGGGEPQAHLPHTPVMRSGPGSWGPDCWGKGAWPWGIPAAWGDVSRWWPERPSLSPSLPPHRGKPKAEEGAFPPPPAPRGGHCLPASAPALPCWESSSSSGLQICPIPAQHTRHFLRDLPGQAPAQSPEGFRFHKECAAQTEGPCPLASELGLSWCSPALWG